MYLESEAERREYVLTQQGFIYQGSVRFIKSVPWNFGQVGQRLPLMGSSGQPVSGRTALAPHGELKPACVWLPLVGSSGQPVSGSLRFQDVNGW